MGFCKTFNPNLAATVNYAKRYSIAVGYCFWVLYRLIYVSLGINLQKYVTLFFSSFLKFMPRILLD